MEFANRRKHIYVFTGLQVFIGPGGKKSAFNFLYSYAQRVNKRRTAYGIITPDFLTIKILFYCKTLAFPESECFRQFRWYFKNNGNAIVSFLFNFFNT